MKNDWRSKIARWLFPDGVEAHALETIRVNDTTIVKFRFTKYGKNTVQKKEL